MFRRRERRFSSAHAIAIAALFFALGGGAYAAVSSLPANSVGTKQLQNGSVTAKKLASSGAQALTRLTPKQKKEIKKLVKAYSRSGPTGPQGPKGDTGPKGDQGAAGASDVYIGGRASLHFETSYVAIASTTVPPGQYLIQAKTTIFGPAENTASRDVCRIASEASGGTEWDGTVVSLPAIPAVQSSAPVSLAGADSFTTEETVVLACKTLGGEALADNARVWATKVGTVHGLPVPHD